MRIAIAGAGGFAYILAQEITQSSNAVMILSSTEHPEFEENLDCQFAIVNYHERDELQYTLQGVDLLISTIGGEEQLTLIEAARRARVRRFVPSEFEGALAYRGGTSSNTSSNRHSSEGSNGAGYEPRDRYSNMALEALRRASQSRHHHQMDYTVFSCGVFYERFQPGGLGALGGMGGSHGVTHEGDYLVDVGGATAEIVETNAHGKPVMLSMTSVYDVARFVAAAIELGPGTWERELRMRGDQMTVRDLFAACSNVRGVPFQLNIIPYKNLRAELARAEQARRYERSAYIRRLISTANGRYHFGRANLNDMIAQSEFVDIRPISFRDWLHQVWGPASAE